MEAERTLKKQIKFELKKEQIYGDKMMLILVLLHWMVASTLTAVSFETYIFGFANGAILSALAVGVYAYYRGTMISRMTFAFILMAYSMIFIQQHLGRIEMHFHIFVAIAFLTVYKDYKPTVFAGVVIALHHIISNELQGANVEFFNIPVYVFNYGCGLDIVMLHAAFVVVEVVTLTFVIIMATKRFKSVVETKFRLEDLTSSQEAEIQKRTSQLQSAKEDAEAANRAKSSFLANMSHEIRTPLNAILGFIDILQEQETNTEKSKYISTIKKSGGSLVEIINDILDFAKVESGKLSVESVPMNPHEEFDNIGALFFAKSEELGLEFHIYIDPSLPTCIEADPLRIRQVITNMLSNAMKFSSSGGKVLLEVKYDNFDKQISFKVRDSGIGIAPENQAKVFEAFSQAEDSTTREFGGTGLGLAISAKLVGLMGGELKVKSELGFGSEFYFSLPIEVCEDECGFDAIPKLENINVSMFFPIENGSYSKVLEEYLGSFGMHNIKYPKNVDDVEVNTSSLIVISSTMYSVGEIKALLEKSHTIIMIKSSLSENYSGIFNGKIFIVDPPFTPSSLYDALAYLYVDKKSVEKTSYVDMNSELEGKVLVAEDQEANQYLMSVILKQLNLEYAFADDGLEAVRMFENSKYDLIFMDENMPNMNGTDATKRIIEIEKNQSLEHTPVVALTANALKGDRERFIEAGMDEYLSKPIDKQKMLAILSTYLAKSKDNLQGTIVEELQEPLNSVKDESEVPEVEQVEETLESKNEVTSGSKLDTQALANKMGYDKEDIEVMLGMFLNKVDNQLATIKEAIDSQDYETVFSTTHAIKGSSGNIGLDEIHELSKIIESAAKHKELINYVDEFNKLKILIDALKGVDYE